MNADGMNCDECDNGLRSCTCKEITVITGLQCPDCKQPELNEKTGLLNFRGLKVMDNDGYWWSECLTCNNWF